MQWNPLQGALTKVPGRRWVTKATPGGRWGTYDRPTSNIGGGGTNQVCWHKHNSQPHHFHKCCSHKTDLFVTDSRGTWVGCSGWRLKWNCPEEKFSVIPISEFICVSITVFVGVLTVTHPGLHLPASPGKRSPQMHYKLPVSFDDWRDRGWQGSLLADPLVLIELNHNNLTPWRFSQGNPLPPPMGRRKTIPPHSYSSLSLRRNNYGPDTVWIPMKSSLK